MAHVVGTKVGDLGPSAGGCESLLDTGVGLSVLVRENLIRTQYLLIILEFLGSWLMGIYNLPVSVGPYELGRQTVSMTVRHPSLIEHCSTKANS